MDPQTASPSPTPPDTHRLLAAFAALNALSAWGGAVALVLGVIDFGDTINQRLPFESLALAGCALAVIVAAPCTLLAWQAWTGRGNVGQTAMLVGVVLMGWIVGQLAVIQSFSWFQPTYIVIGIVIWVAGNRIGSD